MFIIISLAHVTLAGESYIESVYTNWTVYYFKNIFWIKTLEIWTICYRILFYVELLLVSQHSAYLDGGLVSNICQSIWLNRDYTCGNYNLSKSEMNLVWRKHLKFGNIYTEHYSMESTWWHVRTGLDNFFWCRIGDTSVFIMSVKCCTFKGFYWPNIIHSIGYVGIQHCIW